MRRVCVYCGSRIGNDPIYSKFAKDLGWHLAACEIDLVYGGSDMGLMGMVASSVLGNKGKVTAVMPVDLREKAGHKEGTELILVDTMHQRKQQMSDLADAFIVLPGGYGTLDEIFEMLAWRQLNYHTKPCGFLNVNGYFDYLLKFLNHASGEDFIKPEHRALAFAANNVPDLMKWLSGFKAFERTILG